MQQMKLLGLTILGCHEALTRLDDFLDRELSPAETRQVRFHLRLCSKCARKFAWQRDYLLTIQQRLEHLAPSSDLTALQARLDVALASEAARGSSGAMENGEGATA